MVPVSVLYYLPLPQLCVRLASGGDPTYSFNVRLTGEEVHGTSKCIILSPLTTVCVRLASGGDPTYSFNVRLTGEEVHGTSKCIILSPLTTAVCKTS